MIIFAFLAFLIFGFAAIAGGLVLNWLSSLISPRLAAITGVDDARTERFVKTAMLFVVTLGLLFSSQKSCSYGNSFHQEGQKVVSIEEIGYIALGWFLLITAVICLGVTAWLLKIALYGSKPKAKVRKVF